MTDFMRPWWLAVVIVVTRNSVTASDEPTPAAVRATVEPELTTVTVQSVLDAWQTRQDRARTVHCVWELDRTGRNRWSTYQAARPSDQYDNSRSIQSELRLDSEALRYETARLFFQSAMEFGGYNPPETPRYQVPLDPLFHQVTGTGFDRVLSAGLEMSGHEACRARRFVAAISTDTGTELFEPSSAGKPYEATLWRATEWIESEGLMLRPLLFHFRPLHPIFGGIRSERCRMVTSDGFVNGRRCVVVDEVRSATDVNRFWVDSERDFVILRWRQQTDQRPLVQIDVEYATGGDSSRSERIWDPASWSVMVFAGPEVVRDYPGRERVYQFASMNVRQLERGGRQPSDLTEVPILPGTIVLEQSTRKRYLTGNDGSRQILTDRELRRMGLAAADSARSGGFRYEWWLSGAAIAFIVGAVVLKRRRWRRCREVERSGRDES